MKLEQIIEENKSDEWTNNPLPTDIHAVQRKTLSLDHQAEIMMSKLDNWVKIARGKVFTTTGVKSGLKLPKHVEANPRNFLKWTLIHSNPNIVTNVYVEKDDPKIVLPIRALVNRHNELSNKRAETEGLYKKLQAELDDRLRAKAKAAKEARMNAFERDLRNNKHK